MCSTGNSINISQVSTGTFGKESGLCHDHQPLYSEQCSCNINGRYNYIREYNGLGVFLSNSMLHNFCKAGVGIAQWYSAGLWA
jgi:hypothetical protein